MRNPDRIRAVLNHVEKLWHVYPDWRLGQLLCNVATWADAQDIWQIEEDELVKVIERHLRERAGAETSAPIRAG